MQVSNTTAQGTQYTVTTGGPVSPITPPPGTVLTGHLEPGASKEVKPRGSGPWKVMFLPDGERDRIVVEVQNQADCAELCVRSGMLCGELRLSAELEDPEDPESSPSAVAAHSRRPQPKPHHPAARKSPGRSAAAGSKR